MAKRDKRTTEDFIKEMAAINPDIEILGNYVNRRQHIACRCKKCGYEWCASPDHLLHNHGCPKCAGNLKSNTTQFIYKLSKINPDVKVIGRYRTNKDPIHVRCLRCGWEWDPTPNDLLHNYGCPNCCHQSTSYVEQFIYQAFVVASGTTGKVLSRNKTAIGQELDIYVPSKNFAIEYGAWNWHKERLDRDIQKYDLCKQHGIALWTIYDAIPDTDTDVVPQKQTICYKFQLDRKEHEHDLIELVHFLVREAGYEHSFTEQEIQEIEKNAHRSSRLMTTSDFKKKLTAINPDIEVLGEYKNTQSPILCRCKKCGHEWSPVAGSILYGSGCPVCGQRRSINKRTKTPETFIKEMAQKNPDIEVLEDYVNNNTKIKCHCRICGYVWEAAPKSLLKGHGCPQCAGRIRYDTTSFKERMASINPSVDITGEYVNIKTPIACRCNKCGYQWKAIPDHLLRGHGCPVCAGNKKKTTSDFVADLAKKNPNIEVEGEYVNNKTHIKVKCKVCGWEWKPTPNDLLDGCGCPNCAQKKRTKREYTHMQGI